MIDSWLCLLQVKRYNPFGQGVRNCLGQQLARMNVPTAVAMFVSEFEFTVAPEVRLLFLHVAKIAWNSIFLACLQGHTLWLLLSYALPLSGIFHRQMRMASQDLSCHFWSQTWQHGHFVCLRLPKCCRLCMNAALVEYALRAVMVCRAGCPEHHR